jgi:glycosyltransferase involved in cell wall biosynthesis
MRIGFLSQPGYAVLPPAGSLEIWTDEVARRLAARGHEVSIYASRPGNRGDAVHDGVAYRFVEHASDARVARVVRPLHRALPRDRPFFASPAHPRAYWRGAAWRIAADRCDVVHVTNYSQAVPVVRRAHPAATVALHMQCEWLTQLAGGMIGRRLAHADLVLGCSRYITGRIGQRFPELGERLATLYNGVETGTAAGSPGPTRGSGMHLLHVGRISPEKGLHVLVEAFNALVEDHPELTLTFVGEESCIPLEMAVDLFGEEEVAQLRPFYRGPYLAQLQEALSENARARVRFVGRVSHADVARYYREADVFVFPSIFEAFPIPPIEAMAASLPVVATAVGGTVESVRHGETGLLVGRGDAAALARALERLIGDAGLRARLGAAGRRRAVQRFSWDRVCDDFLALAEARRP